MKELTEAQIERQDLVDNAIQELLKKIIRDDIEWDISVISEVRESIESYLCRIYDIPEYEFYPWILEGECD